MNLKFEEAIFGKKETIRYQRDEECATCDGSGAKPGTEPVTCSKCHGSGTIQVERNTPFGRVMTQAVCDVCGGTGEEIPEKCPTCHGSGHVQKTHSVNVTIPAGVEDGQQLRLAGQGEIGQNGGPYGDLYVVFAVRRVIFLIAMDQKFIMYYLFPLFKRHWVQRSKFQLFMET